MNRRNGWHKFIVLFVIFVFAFQGISEEDNMKISTSVDNVLITASVAKTVFLPRENIILNIELHNNSPTEIMLEIVNPIYDFSWNVTTDDSNEKIKMTKHGQGCMENKRWGAVYRCFGIHIQPQKSEHYPGSVNLSDFFVFEANHQYSIEFTGFFLRGDKRLKYTISGLNISITEKIE